MSYTSSAHAASALHAAELRREAAIRRLAGQARGQDGRARRLLAFVRLPNTRRSAAPQLVPCGARCAPHH